MGTNKALLQYKGAPLIRRVAECALAVTDEVFVCANDLRTYSFLKLPVVQDRFPGCGPLAGLHAAFLSTERRRVLLLACDLPNVTVPLLNWLVSGGEEYDAALPVTSDGGIHPLCAVYARNCLPSIEESLNRGRFRILDILEDSRLRIRLLSSSEIHLHDSVFDNLNSPEDLKKQPLTDADGP